MYQNLLERERRRLIYIADSIVDDNPLLLMRLTTVRVGDALHLHKQLTTLIGGTRPVYYEQVYNTLRDNNLLMLIEDGEPA